MISERVWDDLAHIGGIAFSIFIILFVILIFIAAIQDAFSKDDEQPNDQNTLQVSNDFREYLATEEECQQTTAPSKFGTALTKYTTE